jgi:uncharacterized membrane protein
MAGIAVWVALTSPGAALAAAPARPPDCAIGRYQIIDVPLNPAAINDSRLIAGTTASHRAALWSPSGGLQELPLPPGFEHSDAVAINGRGRVVGMAHDRRYTVQRPFLFADGVVTLLPGEHARAFDINDSGDIAGEAVLPGNARSQPVVWTRQDPHPIPTCCGGVARRVDSAGAVVGDAYDADGRFYAFLWSNAGGLQRIGPSKGFSSVVAADDHGRVLVDVLGRTFAYEEGAMTRLELAPRQASHPHAMNGCGVVVGSYGPFSDASRAFAWDRTSGFVDLNTRIAAGFGGKLETATGINDRGDVVGRGDSATGQESGFLLVPTAD